MKNILNLVFIGFLVTNSGCLKTRNDVKEAEESKNLQTQLGSLQKANADYVSRVEETLENHRSLSGRLEVLENRIAKTEGSDSEKQSGSTKAATDINEKIKLLQESMSKLQEENQALQNEVSSLKNSKSSKAELANSGSANDGHAGIFVAAEDLFKQKKWKEAILQYDDYKKKNPKGKLIPEATYKTGVCFQELGMKDEAKVFYQEILTKFPKTEVAHRAQIRLKSL